MKKLYYNVVVVGSGCAGLNALDTLSDNGVSDIALISEGIFMGTSRNTGSDKQTYYKLSIAGSQKDSVEDLANTLSEYGEVDKEICYTEAANSVPCFLKLANLGVEFPTNKYGEYVGYQTDHAEGKRATSAGPLTSKAMWEVLYNRICKKDLKIIDGYTVVKLVKDKDKITGLIALRGDEYIYIQTNYLILATGGPSGIYRDSVYPESQRGMSSLPLLAGAHAVNLHHFQYGIASTSFRWNLSGTYQQVIPKYISIDESGKIREFLLDSNLSPKDIYTNVFLKGYQWPFDSKKVEGSSIIDLLVHNEILKNRKVYLDYRENPSSFNLKHLNKVAYEYLEKSKALLSTPFERLKQMNPLAIELYKTHNIDLSEDLLEIRVCVQNHNGGIKVDCNWQSDIENLFVIGEEAGTFGSYRPGGSALNSTQVSSLRAASEISNREQVNKANKSIINSFVNNELNKFEQLIDKINNNQNTNSAKELLSIYQGKMSDFAAFKREYNQMTQIKKEIDEILISFFDNYSYDRESLLVEVFTTYDALLEMSCVLDAMIFSSDNIGSYGGAISTKENVLIEQKVMDLNRQIESTLEKSFFNNIKDFSKKEDWFETVWMEYRNKRGNNNEHN
ncbi:MAG: FAD-binding protein [Spirochaetaceae bacterium]|nr:FAD-binding protein [Spirochaetaceae bacterium]